MQIDMRVHAIRARSSDTVKNYSIVFPAWAGGIPLPGPVPIGIVVFVVLLRLVLRTKLGRRLFDKFKLKMPAFGPIISKVAIARFTRTLGTLVSSGVPILQALTIVKETAGNITPTPWARPAVKEGETITALETSGVFPPMVISMVSVTNKPARCRMLSHRWQP
jgi:type II secretory pathway component PulF